MKTNRGFTLIEVMLVIVIISILVFVMKPFFQSRNKDFLYVESCINKIHGDMNNFMYASTTSKAIKSGSNSIFPTQYIVKVKDSDVISLQYKDGSGNIVVRQENSLTGLFDYYCTTKNYSTKFSGGFFTLTMDKSPDTTKNRNTEGYSLSGGTSSFTGSTSLYLCYSATQCREVANFEVDIRTQKIKKKKCLTIGDTFGPCTQRDQ